MTRLFSPMQGFVEAARRIAPGLLLGVAFLPASAAPPVKATLHVGFGPTSFTGVNETDAKAAFKVFTQTVGRRRGYELEVVAHTFADEESLAAAVTNRSLHLAIMTGWSYLERGLERYIEPCFLPADSGHGPREYLLLARTDSAIREVNDLRGKRVLLLVNTNCEMSRHWYRTLLLEHRMDPASELAGGASAEEKPAGALLPVFFGKADACVVSRPIFDNMCELNPQVAKRLRILAVSEPLTDSITFLSYGPWDSPRQRPDMMESLRDLHTTPEGQQILTLFRINRMAPFEPAFLDGIRALRAKYDRLSRQAPGAER
jgi:ABC-type phosphate/phosphonate transport system substrate-binding protein